MDIYDKKICIVTYTDYNYLPRAEKTINDIRTNGKYHGDIVVITDGLFKIDKKYIFNMNLIIKEYPDIDVSLLIEKIKLHPFINSDKREYKKIKQWNKLYVFDEYFKNWDFIMFVDAGLRIFDKIEYFYNSFKENSIVAMDDGYPDFTKKFNCQIELSNIEVVNKLKEIYDINSNYFLNCLFIFDTNLIEENTLKELIDIMNDYPIFRTNEMCVMNIYFHKNWIPLDIYLENEKILFDWSERDGKDFTNYVSLKYPKTENMNMAMNIVTYLRENCKNEYAYNLIQFIKNFILDETKLNYELSIICYYVNKMNEGLKSCEELSIINEYRYHAFSCMKFYLKPINIVKKININFLSIEGYQSSNTTIFENNFGYTLITRYVKIIYDEKLKYKTLNENVITELDNDFKILKQNLLINKYKQEDEVQFLGFEDARIFYVSDDIIKFSATYFDKTNKEFISLVKSTSKEIIEKIDLERIADKEKNWLFEAGNNDKNGDIKIIYHWNPFTVLFLNKITGEYKILFKKHIELMKYWKGSCCPISFKNGFLCLVHESYQNIYFHRFVYLDNNFIPLKYSNLFYFEKIGTEFCCGMCHSKDKKNILLTYTVEDKNPVIIAVDAQIIYNNLIKKV